MVLEIIIMKFSCILKKMSRNTFPEPQPDSSYLSSDPRIFVSKHWKIFDRPISRPAKIPGPTKIKCEVYN